ncbi:Type II restriction/modification system, DNA methylase subunit YeeA [Filimonas lacunae]|uniref:site-specific DNA-methyltransferase (adenine-specific) n=1 Tax=Filimonas lacunae TaxID=477680 RepID=A0A173MIG1_9BACT|nr:TaqI-like C-terminal specificity domain-containing protein [Filimonas lacunae]BAV07385.1 type IIS restriction/modification enzyme [Filimonas lacunae]SIT30577.1 Type II restriction/modification system, DNA methylase subunit YeeA [Filimonas lacunae]
MNERQIKDIFKNGGSVTVWKPILDFVFGNVEYFSTPSNPFREDKNVISGKQVGRIRLDQDKFISIFEVEVNDHINIERNRQGLREIAVKYIDQNITHGALVFYHSRNQALYRLTFIAKWSEIDLKTGEFKKGETQKRRYTYLLGENQSGSTAAKRLLEIAAKKPVISIDSIIQAFSVEALTKEFFKKYKEHYERFWRFIDDTPAYKKLLIDTSPEKTQDEQRKPLRDFSKKLLGRIVFLHFLQKKGWMGCPVLSTSKKNKEIWKDGNPSFLHDLFKQFNEQDHFYSKCLSKLFFNTLNQPDRPNNIFPITNSRVPYLNGGLFDNDQPNTDHIDFPAVYFKDLLEFFEQYNFTIDENSPDEQEIGIDPEMLGHIFENLLEENREKGAFYTPKEIVNYMCQESLIEYLRVYMPKEAEIEQFIRKQYISEYLRDRANAIKINNLLDQVKVCDPAIGSGAFPIGILQEIYKAKIHIYPYLNPVTPFDPVQAKKKIIEGSIYGVDLEHGAVEIARLRFWLALVVDEEVPQPLPNLDYKIMQGNSLLERFEDIDLSLIGSSKKNLTVYEAEKDLFGNILESQMKITFAQTGTIKEIQQLMKQYFNEKEPAEKADLKHEINQKVHKHIDYNLELREAQLSRVIEEAGDEEKLNNKARAKLKDLKQDLVSFSVKRARLHDIQNTEEKPYFLWHVFFKDVFDNGGFDIVIGNPPYIQLQKMIKEANELEHAGYLTFTRTGDLYCLFYEQGNNLLKNNGVLAYITSNSWLKTQYGSLLRKYLTQYTNPLKLLNFEDTKIFHSATVETNILLFKKGHWEQKLKAVVFRSDYSSGDSIVNYYSSNSIELSDLSDEGWIILSRKEYDTKNEIEKKSILLKDLNMTINFGIKTGLNEAFIIDKKTYDELIELNPDNAKIIKPIIRGRNVKSYSYKFEEQYIIFTRRGINIDEFPEIRDHLYKSYDRLKPRQPGDKVGRKPGPYKWYEIQDNVAYYTEFEKPKLVWGELSDKPKFAYDDKGMYPEATLFFMTGDNLKYLLSILNSRLASWYFNQITTTSGMGTNRWKKYKIEQLPIAFINSNSKKIEVASDYMLFLNDTTTPAVNSYTENENIAQVFEDTLNMMIYELYFEEHMKELEVDVLQFITEDTFPPLTKNPLENAQTVGRIYKWLQERDNPIRNRIISANINSNYIRGINSTTH